MFDTTIRVKAERNVAPLYDLKSGSGRQLNSTHEISVHGRNLMCEFWENSQKYCVNV